MEHIVGSFTGTWRLQWVRNDSGVGENHLEQFRSRYLDLHSTTARERYDLLMQRCPGIVEHLDLQDIASFLRSTSGRFACKERPSQHHQQNPPRHHV